MDESETVNQLAREISRKTAPMELVLKPDSVFHLVGLLQLTKRHPDLPSVSRRLANTFIASAMEYFADSPTILDVIRRGDDPAEDVRRI